MNIAVTSSRALRAGDFFALLARWGLGALFIYMGLNKALHPVDFLKLVRQYELVDAPLWLNLIAAGLPWFEVYCAVLLLLGVAVRGTAVMLAAMLIPFTLVVLRRALTIYGGGDIAFCAIKFDCGCGGGEVFICKKIVENMLLTACAIWLAFRSHHRLAIRSTLFVRQTEND